MHRHISVLAKKRLLYVCTTHIQQLFILINKYYSGIAQTPALYKKQNKLQRSHNSQSPQKFIIYKRIYISLETKNSIRLETKLSIFFLARVNCGKDCKLISSANIMSFRLSPFNIYLLSLHSRSPTFQAPRCTREAGAPRIAARIRWRCGAVPALAAGSRVSSW